MADVALRLGPVGDYFADMAIEDDDVASDEGLQTAILLSLGTDRRANDDDNLPAGDSDKRGWWADEFAENEGDLFGSRLWLLDRGKRLPDIENDAAAYAAEALQWLIDDRVASSVDVSAAFRNDGALLISIVVTRPTGKAVDFQFEHVWEGQLAV